MSRKQGKALLRSASISMPEGITVTIPARLHLGFLDLNGGLGRRFGSIGLAISGLRTKIAFRRARKDHITGPERERVMRHVDKMMQRLALGDSPTGGGLAGVPAPAGRGSGTH